MASSPHDDDLTPQRSSRLGRRGLAIAGILLVAANLRTGITVVGPLLGDVRDDLALSNIAASALITIPVLCFALVSPLAPPLMRRFGIERTLAVSLGLLAAALVLRALPVSWALWFGTVLIGVAIAILNVILPALLKRDFPGQTGKLTGAYSAVQSGFAALASGLAVPVAGLSDSGWRLSFGIWAGLALIALAVFWPQLRGAGRPALTGPVTLPGGGVLRSRSPWGSAIGWQVTIFMGVQSTMFYTLLTWWPSIDEANGFTTAEAGLHQSILQVCGIGGNLLVAALLQRYVRDQRKIMLILGPLPVIGLAGLLLFPQLSLLWNIVFGFAAGGTIVLALSLFGLRTRHHRQTAAISGMAQSIGYLLAAAGPMAMGALHDATGSWTPVLLSLLGLLFVQIAAGTLASRDRTVGERAWPGPERG